MPPKQSPLSDASGFARLKQISKSLRHRNYRLYFLGQGLSLIGTWMTQIAVIWLVYHLTNSPLLLGIVGFISQSPNLVLAPIAGFLSDRYNRHHILLLTQSLSLLRSLLLVILVVIGELDVWHLVVLSFLQGILTAIDLPTRQAFIAEMIETKEDLGNAIALSSSLVSGARLIGPAIAGLLLNLIGAAICFLLDALSYTAVIAALLAMKLPASPQPTSPDNSQTWQEICNGFNYVLQFAAIHRVLLFVGLTNFLGTPFIALGPVFAREVLQGQSDVFGLLMTTSAIGALLGALYLSYQSNSKGLAKLIVFAPGGLGIGLILFSQSHVLGLSLLAIAWIGLMLVIQNAASNTFIQTIVEDSKRGQVMGLFILTSESGIPLGNLFAGILASQIGAQMTLAVEGLLCILASFLFVRCVPLLQQTIASTTQ